MAWLVTACGLQQEITLDPEPSPPETGLSVLVEWDGRSEEVFLDNLDRLDLAGRSVVALWDVLVAAGLEVEGIPTRRFDFEAADGYRPSLKGCDPLNGETLAGGYIDPESLALLWEEDLGLRGCYWVTELARILAEPQEAVEQLERRAP